MALVNNTATAQNLSATASLNDRQYRLWQEMFENRTGVRIAAQREGFVRNVISRRMGECGFVDGDCYFRDVLETLGGKREWGVLLDRLLVKETRFFRHQPSHNFVRDRVAQHSLDTNEPFDIWSAGCATGEETYSLAIDAFEGFAQTQRPGSFSFSVTGTDISSDAVATARQGRYLASHMEDVPLAIKRDYMSSIDERYMEVNKGVRRRVAFIINNMLDAQAGGLQGMDLIFCQNVLIYFKRWRRRDIVNMFCRALKPGGCLVIGPGELSDWQPAELQRISLPGIQAYQKIS